jgi:hypothetical protein
MSATKKKATVWTCDGCGVSIKQMDGGQSTLPDSWDSSDQGQYCLICRRSRVAEEAVEAASHEERAQMRREALLDFEVRRTPERSNGEIARACRTSVPAVAKARKRLSVAEPS